MSPIELHITSHIITTMATESLRSFSANIFVSFAKSNFNTNTHLVLSYVGKTWPSHMKEITSFEQFKSLLINQL